MNPLAQIMRESLLTGDTFIVFELVHKFLGQQYERIFVHREYIHSLELMYEIVHKSLGHQYERMTSNM